MSNERSPFLMASAPMHFHAALMVFESWDRDPDDPEHSARAVRCCGRPVVQRNGVMTCDACDTAIARYEFYGHRWQVLRVKGRWWREIMGLAFSEAGAVPTGSQVGGAG